MKKQEYVSPEMEVIEIKTQCMLAVSTGDADGDLNSGTKPPSFPGAGGGDDE